MVDLQGPRRFETPRVFVAPGALAQSRSPLNSTNRPSAEIPRPLSHVGGVPGPPDPQADPLETKKLPWVPSDATLTRSVTPVIRSCTKTSNAPFVSPGTRLLALLANATNRPSAEMDGQNCAKPSLGTLLGVPSDATSTRSVTWDTRSYTNTPIANEASMNLNATNRPSAEMDGQNENEFRESTLRRSVVPARR